MIPVNIRTISCILLCASLGLSQNSSPLNWFLDLRGENSGHTVANFVLTLPVSAAGLSMSDAASTGMMDATDVPVFPSNTALFSHQKLAATHLEWLLDTRVEYTGVCFPINDVGTIGAYAKIFTPGTIANARDIDQEPSHPSMFELAAGASFAKSFFNKSLSLGACISYVESKLDEDASGRTAIVNADLSYRPSPVFNAHLYAGNFGPDITYYNQGEPLPTQAGLGIQVTPLALRENISDIFTLSIGLGAKKIADEPLIAGGSLQADLFKRVFFRAGYDYSLGTHSRLAGLCAGAGITLSRFGADFGWKNKSEDLGSVWALSVRMDMKEIVLKTAEEYYKTAERFFGKKRMLLCVYNAKKALALNPSMWKAHALIAMVKTQERRNKNLEIALLYTGNAKGQFMPLALDKGTMGGLARQATAIKTLRSRFPTNILIDGGNIISAKTHPLKCRLSQTFYDDMGFDAVCVGEQEKQYGLSKIYPQVNTRKTGVVCSNLISRFGLGNMVTNKVVSKNGYQVFVMSVLSPSLLPNESDQDNLFSPLDEVRRNLSLTAAKASHVRVIVVHDKWENIPGYAALLRQGDIILCSSIRQEFATPMKIGAALVLSTGEFGKYVGNLVLRFAEDKSLLSCENHLIPLTEDVPADSGLEVKTRMITAKVDLDSTEVDERTLMRGASNGVFAFCSKRRDAAAIYLKVLAKNAEFPLTSGKNDCGNPVVSFGASKIAYFEKDPDSVCSLLSIMDLTGTSKRKIPLVSCPACAAFSPNGAWLYFSAKMTDGTTDLFRIRPDGMVVVPVVAWKNSSEGEIEFSPDGANMVFTSNGNGRWQLFLSDPDGVKPVCLTDNEADYTSPRYSPDAKHLALLSNKTSFSGSRDLWLYNFTAATFIHLTHGAKVRDFCWLDAKTIVYSAGDTGKLYSLDITTKNFTRLVPPTPGEPYGETTPRVLGAGLSKKIIYTRENDDGTKRIFRVDPDGKGNQVIVNSNTRDWLE
jgi:hypothetical protein